MALTIKQERFAMLFLETGNASEAYRQAYNAENMSDQAVWNEASALTRHHEVAGRLEAARQAAAQSTQVTLESVIAELEEARQLALGAEQAGAAVSATMGKAKLAGLEVDRSEVTTRQGADKPDLEALLAQSQAARHGTSGTESAQDDSASLNNTTESMH